MSLLSINIQVRDLMNRIWDANIKLIITDCWSGSAFDYFREHIMKT
jgi:hypothetical protein